MASESELRDRFHEGTLPSGQIDVAAVLRRSRARRRPRMVLAGAGSVLAIAAIAVPATLGSFVDDCGRATRPSSPRAVPETAPNSRSHRLRTLDSTGQSAYDRPPAEKLNLCSAPVAEVASRRERPRADRGTGDRLGERPRHPDHRDDDEHRQRAGVGNDGRPAGHDAVAGRRDALAQQRPADHDRDPGRARTRRVAAVPGDLRTGAVQRRGRQRRDASGRICPPSGVGLYQLSAAIDFTRNDGSFIDLVTGPAVRVSLS